ERCGVGGFEFAAAEIHPARFRDLADLPDRQIETSFGNLSFLVDDPVDVCCEFLARHDAGVEAALTKAWWRYGWAKYATVWPGFCSSIRANPIRSNCTTASGSYSAISGSA